MKKIVFLFLFVVIITSIQSQSALAESISSDNAYYEQKKLAGQDASTKMRYEYYQKYKAKWWYDLSILTSELLDGRLTGEWQFWEALKKMQNLKEIPERKIYVDKLSKYGADTSEFTESTIADSGKFWELYKKWEWVLKTNIPATEKKEVYVKEVRKEESVSYQETKNTSQIQKTQTQDRAIKIFILRLDRVPTEKLPATLEKLQKNIKNQMEVVSKKWSKLMLIRLDMMLKIVEERMESDSDEAMIESLFAN